MTAADASDSTNGTALMRINEQSTAGKSGVEIEKMLTSDWLRMEFEDPVTGRKVSAITSYKANRSSKHAEPATEEKKWEPYAKVAHEINEPISKAYLQALGDNMLCLDQLAKTEQLQETPKQLDTLIEIYMTGSKILSAIDSNAAPEDMRKALRDLDAAYVEGLGYMLEIKKGLSLERTRKLTHTSWLEEVTKATQALDNSYINLLTHGKLPLSDVEQKTVADLLHERLK